ncbi:hypothetical protein SAMN05216388_100452 [Halorientalis persicus]|jgi:hypothetical protein|uniref:Uncharacterized protein n=1 Tax=Halorientalis persicus TaxID=1367881 RepID=A0A1H8I2L3_9EURY|nr:hypothetical protein [Halorientalis persicus]SEN62457.1 hypothetical protein SAMN05216388_100452 [Halorientalis persicus]
MGLFDADEQGSDYDASEFEVTDESPFEGDSDAGPDLALARIHDENLDGTLKRVIDHKAGVIVYAYDNGLAAVPISQTDLQIERK